MDTEPVNIPFTEEPMDAIGEINLEQQEPAPFTPAVETAEAERRRQTATDTLTAMAHVSLRGVGDTDSEEWLEEHPEYADFYSDTTLADKGAQDYLIGNELARDLGNGDAFGLLYSLLEKETDPQKREAFAAELEQCSSLDATALLGRKYKENMRAAKEEQNKKEAQFTLAVNKMQELWQQQGGSVMRGTGIPSAELFDLAEANPQVWQKLNEKAPKARAALNIVENWMRGGMSAEEYNAALEKEYANVRSEEASAAAFSNALTGSAIGAPALNGKRMSEADARQQARANLSETILKNRADYKLLADALSDENGNLDEQAVYAFTLMMEDAVNEQQTLDPQALRSFMGGLTSFLKESVDLNGRIINTMPYVPPTVGTPGMLAAPNANPNYGSNTDLYTDRRSEKIKDILTPLEKERLDVSERADYVSKMLGDVSYIAGNSAVPTLAGMAAAAATGGVLAPWLAAAAATYPSAANTAITSAVANDMENPLLIGLLQGAPQAAAEGLFDIIPGGGAGRSLLNMVARKSVALPVAGRMLESIQANTLMRWVTGAVTETVGETLEDPLAELTNEIVFTTLQRAGMDIEKPEFSSIRALADNLNPRQLTATMGYSLLLGMGGIRAEHRKARRYAMDRDNLLASGHSAGKARELSVLAQQTDEEINAIMADDTLTREEKLTKAQEKEQQLTETLNREYEKDVLQADEAELEKRFTTNAATQRQRNVLALTAASGARDIVLKRNGIIAAEPQPNGKYLLTFNTTAKDGTPTETQKELSSEALNGWLALRQNEALIDSIKEYQAKLSGKQLSENAKAELEDLGIKLLDLGTQATPAFNEAFVAALQSKEMNVAMFRKLAALQNAEIENFINSGMAQNRAEAEQRESSYIPGVSAGNVAGLINDVQTRIEQGQGTTELAASGIVRLNDSQRIAAVRFNGLNGGSVIAYFEGNISAANLAEDIWEAKLTRAVSNGSTTWRKLAQQLFRAQADMQRIDPAIKLFKKGITAENAQPQQIIEAYSSLQAADLLTNYAAMPLNSATKTLLGEVLASTRAMRAAALTAQAWQQVKKQADADLATYLQQEGLAVANYITPAMEQTQAEMNKLEANDLIPDPAPAVQETVQAAKAEQQENAEHPAEPAGTPQPIPAEESITGASQPADNPLVNAPYNPQTGELAPRKGHPIRHGKKKGAAFANNAYQEETDGTLTGAVPVDNLRIADFPALKEQSTISGEWNPLSAPIKGVQLKDGTIVIYSGRARLAHAKATGTPYILVNVKKASDIKSDLTKWMRVNDACDNLLNGTASAEQVALAWSEAKKQGISYERFDSMGLVMKDTNGESTATMQFGVTIVENLTEKQLQKIMNGEKTAEQLMRELNDALLRRMTETKQQKIERQTKSRAKWKPKDKKLTSAEQETLVLKESAKTTSKKDYRYVLQNILRKVSKGVVEYVSTDGRRLVLFSKKTSEKDSEQLLKPDGTQADTESKFPFYKQVIPDDSISTRATVQFNLQDVPSAPNSTSKSHRTYTLDFGTTSVQIDTSFLNDAINQVKALSQNMGASPVVTIGYSKGNTEERMQPITITDQAGEWTYKSVIMPVTGNAPTVRVPIGQESVGETQPYVDKFEMSQAMIQFDDKTKAYLDGRKLTAGRYVLTPAGNIDWFVFPQDSDTQNKLKEAGLKNLPFRLRVGSNYRGTGFGLLHAMNHMKEMESIGESPVDFLYNTLSGLDEAFKQEKGKVAFNAAIEEKDLNRRIVVQLFEDDGCYSIITGFPAKNKPHGEKLAIEGTSLNYRTRGGSIQIQLQVLPNAPGKPESTTGRASKGIVANKFNSVNIYDIDFVNKDGSSFRLPKAVIAPSTFSLSADNPDDLYAAEKRARRSTLAERMMHHAQAEANRFRRTVKGRSNAKEAAEVLASVVIAMETARRYVPTARLPRMTEKRAALEAYVSMMQQGRYGVNRNGSTKRRGLTAEELAATEERAMQLYEQAVSAEENLTEAPLNKQRQKELMRDFIRTAAREGIGNTAAAIMDDISNAIATELSRKLIERMNERIKALEPYVSASRRPIRAKVAPEAYKDFGLIREYMNLTREEYQAQEQQYYADYEAAAGDEAKQAELDRKFSLLQTYGAISTRSYGEVQIAAANLEAYINTERHLWEDKMEERKAEITRLKTDFLTNTKAEVGSTIYREKLREEAKNMANTLGSFFKQLQSPAQFFLALSGNPALAELAQRTMSGIANANVSIGIAERNRRNAMLSRYAALIGITPQGVNGTYTEQQLEKLGNNQFADFTQDLLRIKQTNLTRTYIEPRTGEEVTETIKASDGQLMNLLLMAEQPFYASNAERWGYTPELIADIKAHLGETKVQFAYALREVLQSDRLPAIFQERTGIIMSENPTYWPGHLAIANLAEKENAAIIGDYSKNGTYGMLKNRVDSNYDFAIRDIMSVFMAASAQRHNYIHVQPITAPWRSLLADETFSARLEGTIGADNKKMLQGFLDALDGAAMSEGFMHNSVNKAVSRYMSGYARSLLAFSPTTIIRQMDAALHGALGEETNAIALSAQILKDRARTADANDPHMTYAKICELPAFRARHGGSAVYEELLRSGANATWSRLGSWMRTGMNIIEKTDLCFNAISACALYNLTYDRITKQNQDSVDPLTEEEIRAICEEQVTTMLELTAQPLRRTQKSAYVILNNNVLADCMAFLGSETLNKIGYATARYNRTLAATGSHAKAFGSFMKPMATMGIGSAMLGVAIAFLRTAMTGDDADKLDWLAYFGTEALIGGTGSDMLADIPLLGKLFDLRGEHHGNWPIPGATEWKRAKKLFRMATEDRDHSASEYYNEATRLSRDLSRDMHYLAGFNSNARATMTVASGLLDSMTAAMNIAYPFSQGAEKRAIWTRSLPDSWQGTIIKRAPRYRRKKKEQDWLHELFAE